MTVAAFTCILFAGCASMKAFAIDYVKPTMVQMVKTAWNENGKTAVDNKLAELVKDGKLTQKQADILSKAAAEGFDKLIEKVSETTTSDDVEKADVEVSKETTK